MRLWSLHPRHLDRAGLVALWREGLLALAVLAGRTRGYRHHPQLARFRAHATPLEAIAAYLHAVVDEAERRGYRFDVTKLPRRVKVKKLTVTRGQLAHELEHLAAKLRGRSADDHAALIVAAIEAHPLFVVVEGEREEWERVRTT